MWRDVGLLRQQKKDYSGAKLLSGLVCLVLSLGSGAGIAGTSGSDRPPWLEPADSPPVAYWPFDGALPTEILEDRGASGWHGRPTPAHRGSYQAAPGVFGQAILLEGEHHLAIPNTPWWDRLEKLTIMAWVLPRDLSTYREILRKEDGERRILFSFQDHGRHLTLGLNIDGVYVECDAPIQPGQVLDGAWHHVAASFDGQTMRVYLDGRIVGSLERPGQIHSGGPASPYLASLQGTENFQGLIDELAVFDRPLEPSTIQAIWYRGLVELVRKDPVASELLGQYRRAESFSSTVARLAAELSGRADPAASAAFAIFGQLVAHDFRTEAELFTAYTGLRVAEIWSPGGREKLLAAADHLAALLVEYRPITAEQWAKLTAEEREHWKRVDDVAARFLQLRSEGSPSIEGLVDFILRAGPLIAFRPQVFEAVAPYVRPSTPATRTLTAEEARAVLEADWLHQADGRPSVEVIRRELERTEKLLQRLQQDFPQLDLSAERAELASLAKDIPTEGENRELYFRVRELKRRIFFRNPVVDFDSVLFIDQPFPQGSEWKHETRHRLGYMAVPGGRLLVLEGLHPAGRLRQLAPQGPFHGSFWRPDLSFDADRVLFCFKPHNEKTFHLYEVRLDGTELRQLTDGPYDDLDPIYLPDDKHIIFVTTRGHTYVRCMPPTNAFVLARCDRDGKNIYLISANNEPDYLPVLTPEGRILYTRWEYTDKPVWRAQGLWTVRPDGTKLQVVWGNQSVWPDLLKDARVIPGTRKILFTGSAHHDWFAGCLGVLDPDEGFNFPRGVYKITRELPWPESGNGPVDPYLCEDYYCPGRYEAYYSPYPLGEKDFLVSAKRNGKFVLYLMDIYGNRELIYEGVHHIFYAQPVRKRPRPPVLPEEVAWPTRAERDNPRPGILYSGSVYQNAPPELRGHVRALRVWTIDHKTYTYWYKRPYVSTGPVVSAVQSDGVKRLLGTVPVESDGSVAFYAPAGLPLHFQLLDERGRALQTMRSFVHVMPGERRGCLGCHEAHSRAPVPELRFLPLRQPVRELTPPPWEDRTVSYPRYVQPVLDRYCGKCHQGDGEAVSVVDFTPRPGLLGFAQPYFLLTGNPTWGRPYVPPPVLPPGFGIAGMLMVEGYDQRDPAAYRTPEPMRALSFRSRLVDICSSGEHYGVKVDEISLARLIAWIDAMCPYNGEEEIRAIPDPEFQGIDWLAIRPRIQTAPRVTRPGPVD